jgi:hypothetical protein
MSSHRSKVSGNVQHSVTVLTDMAFDQIRDFSTPCHLRRAGEFLREAYTLLMKPNSTRSPLYGAAINVYNARAGTIDSAIRMLGGMPERGYRVNV